MNTKEGKWYRSLAVLALVAAGILTTIASGGGGGGGGGGDDGATNGGPTLAITEANGEAVSSAVMAGVTDMFDFTEATEGPLFEPTAGTLPVLQKIGGMPGAYSEAPVEGTEPCAARGTIAITGELADPLTLTVGDTLTAVFDNCDDQDGFLINGELGLTVTALNGDPFSDVFLLTLDLVLTDLTITADSETITGNGDLTYTLDTLGFPAILTVLSGVELSIAADGETIIFRDFDQTLEVDLGTVPTSFTAAANGTLENATLGGSVDYETVVTIQASGEDNPPYTGEIRITGAESSSVRIVIVSEQVVRLEIDVNGDGVVDEFIDTTWAELLGETGG
jgi:hypothetical protein